MSASRTGQTSSGQTSGTSTTTPNVPSWLEQPAREIAWDITRLGQDNSTFMNGPSTLQNIAYHDAAKLGTSPVVDRVGGGQVNAFDEAGRLITGATRSPANTAGNAAQAAATGYQSTGYNAAGPAQMQGYQASGPAQTTGYQAAGPAAAQSYQSQAAKAAQLGQAQGYQAAQINGAPINVKAGQAQASSLLQGLPQYQSQYTNAVVDTTLAGLDRNAARQKAAMDSAAGRERAFGGSGYAIREGTYAADNNLNRAATEASLRDQAFNTAAGLSNLDAQRRTDVSQSNAGLTTNANIAGAGLNLQRDQSNQSATNTARQFGAAANNDFARTQAGFQQQVNLDNAGRADAAAALLAQARNTSALDYTGRQDSASQFGANARNNAALDYAGRNDAASAFGANARNNSALDYAGRSDTANRYGADARNQASQFGAQAQNNASQFNASAQNQMSQFNAGQQDNALMRQLQGAGLMQGLGNDLLSNERANIALQAGLGAQQRDISNQQLQEDYIRADLLSQMLGRLPFSQFSGSTTRGSGTTTGSGSSSGFGIGTSWNPADGFGWGGRG